jgi:cytochrome c-type biogenesis protein
MTYSEIVTSLSIGLLATTSPCVLPLYPGFLAYLSGGTSGQQGSRLKRALLGAFVLAGVLSMMLLLGALMAALSISVGQALSVTIPIADGLILLLGGLLLFNINPFKSLPQVQVPLLSHPWLNAYVYGLLYGPIALPCSGPLVVGIFAYSLTATELLSKLTVFLWFGLGFGLPLLALSLLSVAMQRWLTRQFALRARLINRIGGLLLVGVGIYDLVVNWPFLNSLFS